MIFTNPIVVEIIYPGGTQDVEVLQGKGIYTASLTYRDGQWWLFDDVPLDTDDLVDAKVLALWFLRGMEYERTMVRSCPLSPVAKDE